jgi:beta-N-acetylhexosaminidase
VLDVPASTLADRELVPFRAAIAAGVAAVLSAHLVVPALDDRPATVSPPVLVDLLRHELGFAGAVVTDALDMEGIGGGDRIPRTVVDALAAGADLCCLGSRATDPLVTACVEAVVTAVERGDLAEARLVEAAGRVAHLANGSRPPMVRAVPDLERLGLEAARRAVRTEGETLVSGPGAVVIELAAPENIAVGEVPWGLGEALAVFDPTVTVERVDPDATASERALASAAGRPLVVVCRDAHRIAAAHRLLATLAAARPDAVVVDFGWPHPDPPVSRGRIVTFGAAPPCAAAAAELLAGRLAASAAANPAGGTHG